MVSIIPEAAWRCEPAYAVPSYSVIRAMRRVMVLLDQLEHGHGGRVALAWHQLHDARVAAVPVRIAWPDLVEEPAQRVLVGEQRHGQPAPTQGPAIFGQDVVAEDQQTFSWPLAADVVYVKGDLADVSTYTVDLVDSVALTSELTDSSEPVSGAGFYYLVRPDCLVGSWQTSLGAEPERDLVLP